MQKINLDGRTTSNVPESRLVEIRPGSSKETVIRMEKAGNESPGQGHVSDLIFKIKEV
jgi:DnaJ-class molecular chaperone